MVTHSQVGIIKPNTKYALFDITSIDIPHEPRNIRSILAHPSSKMAMNEELVTLHRNHIWKLIPRTPNMHVIGSK